MVKNSLVAAISRDKIYKMSIYVNKEEKSLAEIVEETGCDYAINGTIFEWTKAGLTPCADLKVKGDVLYESGYTEWGLAWNMGNDFVFDSVPANVKSYQNYINCKTILKNRVVTTDNKGELGGTRGRSAIGILPDHLVLVCMKDGTASAMSPVSLAEHMRNMYGCTDVLMLDGGGSSQCYFNGESITATRVVHDLILIWTHDPSPTYEMVQNPVVIDPETGTENEMKWLIWQLWNRVGMLVPDTTSYTNDIRDAVSRFQKLNYLPETGVVDYFTRLLLTICGYSYYDVRKETTCPYANIRRKYDIVKGHVSNSVKWVQWHLIVHHNYALEINGRYLDNVEDAIRKFQYDHDLPVTGICDPETQDLLASFDQ